MVWVVFIGGIFAGSCKSHPGIPRRLGDKEAATGKKDGEKFNESLPTTIAATPCRSPPPRSASATLRAPPVRLHGFEG